MVEDAGPDGARPGPRRDGAASEAEPEDLESEGAGSRLRPLYVTNTYEDGAVERIFAGVFGDRERGVFCRVREIGSEAYACVPEFIPRGIEAFADPACSAAVIAFASPSQEATIVGTGAQCAPAFFAAADAEKAPSYVKNADGSCVRTFGEDTILRNPQRVALSLFVSFTRTEDTTAYRGYRSGSRLTLERRRFTGADGSFFTEAPRVLDRDRSAEGRVQRSADGKLRLLSATRWFDRFGGSSFADSTCATPLFAVGAVPRVCHDETLVSSDLLMRSSAGCGLLEVVRQPTGAPASAVYKYDGTSCLADDPSRPRPPLYPASAVESVPLATFAEITERVEPNTRTATSGTKLEARAVVQSSADGLELTQHTSRLYLRKHDLPCGGDAYALDGKDRCVPSMSSSDFGEFFSDAACTEGLLRLYGTDACGKLAPFYRDSATDRIYRTPTSEPLAPETIYVKESGGGCQPRPAGEGFIYVAAGAPEEIPLDDFPLLKKRDVSYGR